MSLSMLSGDSYHAQNTVLGARVFSKLRTMPAIKSVFKECGINGWINRAKSVRKLGGNKALIHLDKDQIC